MYSGVTHVKTPSIPPIQAKFRSKTKKHPIHNRFRAIAVPRVIQQYPVRSSIHLPYWNLRQSLILNSSSDRDSTQARVALGIWSPERPKCSTETASQSRGKGQFEFCCCEEILECSTEEPRGWNWIRGGMAIIQFHRTS